MVNSLDCIPCFARQAVELAKEAAESPEERIRLIQILLDTLSRTDLSVPPPVMAEKLYQVIDPFLQGRDIYQEVKKTSNNAALLLYDRVKRIIETSPDPFETAVRFAIAGNSIDVGANPQLKITNLDTLIDQAEKGSLTGSAGLLKNAVSQSSRILFLADNAGEIVLDKLLIHYLPKQKITVAVRGSAILNDATIEDARDIGLTDWVKVISNGSRVPGTVLEDCSSEFREHFVNSDLIISKGQGNFETLYSSENKGRNIFFLLKIKCSFVAGLLGIPEGSFAMVSNLETGVSGAQEPARAPNT